jgi:hypothetical protein
MSTKDVLKDHFQHVVEGLVEVVGDELDLHLFCEQILLDLIDSDVEPLDVHQSIFFAIFSAFQRVAKVLDL